jgi:hypothetical protein
MAAPTTVLPTEATSPDSEAPFQLSPAEKARIKAEESFRLQLRSETDKGELKSSVMNFLNSAFGLFLLSTLLVSGLGTYLSRQYQEKAAKLVQHEEAIKHLVELDYRLAQLDYRLLKIDTQPDEALAQSKCLTDIIEGRGTFQPSLKEYEGLNMIGLMSWFNYNIEKTPYRTRAYHHLRSFLLLKEPKGIYDTRQVRIALGAVNHFRNEVNTLLLPEPSFWNWLKAIGTGWGIASLCGLSLAAGAFLVVLLRKRFKHQTPLVAAT